MRHKVIILSFFWTCQLFSKTIFLTGAAGFIGSNFLKYMFEKYPQYHFIVLDNLTYAGSLENIPQSIKNSPRFQFYYGSVTNEQFVDKLMSQSNLVVHFAAESHVTRSINDDKFFFDTDLIGTRAMMMALVNYKDRVERFIHISTSEVYGTAETQPMSEDHPLNPRSPYAAAKAGADRLVYSYCCTYDIPAVIVRPFNNYGPQQHPEKMIPRFIAQLLKGQKLTIHGNGQQKRDWIHTDDTCRALDLILHASNFERIKHQVINLGSGIATSVFEIAKLILKEFNLPSDHLTFIGDRPGQVQCHISSTRQGKKLLGWAPQISIEEGIKKAVSWYKNNLPWLKQRELLQYVPIITTHQKIELH